MFAELVQACLRFIALYIIFGKLHRPNDRWKKIIAYCLMILEYPIQMAILSFAGGTSDHSIAVGIVIFLLLALLCRRDGDWVRPFISAFYVTAMFMTISIVLYCYAFMLVDASDFLAQADAGPSMLEYAIEIAESLLYVLWAIFYYRVSRKMLADMPRAFLLLIILMPFVVACVSMFVIGNFNQLMFAENGPKIAEASKLFLYTGLFGTMIIIFNMCAFYLYVRLSVVYESLRFAQDLAHTPPVWTAEQGLSALFIEKYQISPRERQVINILLLGKTDKEIALELELAVNTVQTHIKRVYRKTGAAGRFALSALVHGE